MQLGQVRLNTQGDVVNTPDEDATTQDDGTG
jgi:hypothetical protein